MLFMNVVTVYRDGHTKHIQIHFQFLYAAW
jgi:hypothetical protein